MLSKFQKAGICLLAGTMALSLTCCINITQDKATETSDNGITVTDDLSEITATDVSEATTDQPSEATTDQPSETTTAAPSETAALEATGYTVSYTDGKVGKVMLVNFEQDNHSYEMCVNGIPFELAEDQIQELIDGFLQNEPIRISDEDIVDAEKKSNKLCGSLGDFVVTNEDRQDESWGDKSMCWAASSSDMLYVTGWAQYAAQNNAELAFDSEDDVFKYYKKYYNNSGYYSTSGYQNKAIQWFFEGDTYGENDGPANIPDVNADDYIAGGPLCANPYFESDEIVQLSDFADYLEVLKDGGSIGIAVEFNTHYYSLKSDEDAIVEYNTDLGAYALYNMVFLEADDENILESYYCYNNKGQIVKLEKEDDTYVDATGNVHDAINVIYGKIYDLQNGSYGVITEEYDELLCEYYTICDESEIDFASDSGTEFMIGNGAHALTVSGYIMDLTETDANNTIKALFITDSDDDAGIYEFTADNHYDEICRPNCITLYNTKTVTASDTLTLDMDTYMEDTDTLLAYISYLKKCDR